MFEATVTFTLEAESCVRLGLKVLGRDLTSFMSICVLSGAWEISCHSEGQRPSGQVARTGRQIINEGLVSVGGVGAPGRDARKAERSSNAKERR